MTSQEEQMLNSLVERVNSTQLTEKDPDAAELLERGFGKSPDAVYMLAQTVLVQNIALEQARAQLSEAQEQLGQAQQPPKATSFLGSLLGHRDPAPPQQPPYQQVYTPQGPPEYQVPYGGPYQPSYQPSYQGPYAGPAYGSGPQYVVAQQPSFLRSAAQTAAGVAAGALAFEGVEALLHGGFGHPGMGMGMGGWGMPGVGYGMGRPMEETIINNNYYDSSGPEHSEHSGQEHGGEHHFHDSSSDGNAQLSNADWDSSSAGGWDSGPGIDDSSVVDDNGSFGGDDGVL